MKDLTHYFNIGGNSCTVSSSGSDKPQSNKKVVQEVFIDLCGDDDDDNHDPLCISCHRDSCRNNSKIVNSSQLLNGTVPSSNVKDCIKDCVLIQSKRLRLNKNEERIFVQEKCVQLEKNNETHAKISKSSGESCGKELKLKHNEEGKVEESSKRKLNFGEEDSSNQSKRAKSEENQNNFENTECECVHEQQECTIESNLNNNNITPTNFLSVKEHVNNQHKVESERTQDNNVSENKCKTLIKRKPKKKLSLSRNKISSCNESSVQKIEKCDQVRNESDSCIKVSDEERNSTNFKVQQKVCSEEVKNELCVSSPDILRNENSNNSDSTTFDGRGEESLESPKTIEKNKICDGLFKYFSKVCKEEYIAQTEIQKITVEAVVHSVSGDVSTPPKLGVSTKKIIRTRNRSKIREQLNSSDRIDVISSELLVTNSDNSIYESSPSFYLKTSPTSCTETINTINNKRSCTNGSCTDLEKHVNSVNLSNSEEERKHDVNTKVCEDNSSCTSDNKKHSIDPSGLQRKSWVMRVRLNSNTVKENPQVELSEEESQHSIDSLQCLPVVPCDSENSVIDIDDCSTDSSHSDNQILNMASEQKNEEPQKSTPVQLCTIFLKGRKPTKSTPDPRKLEARTRFLESGTPDVIKRIVDSQKSENHFGIPAQFPTVSHVQQHDVTQPPWNDNTPAALKLCPPFSPLKLSPIMWSSLREKPVPSKPATKLIPVVNKKELLKELKDEEPEMDVKSWYKSFTERRQKNSVKDEPVNDTFTDMYKPACAADIIGNTESISKFKVWLESQKKCFKREGSVSSGDEFVNYDSEEEENKRVNNMVIICGPHGCGKTSTVYALASELGYKVLEINASCNRNGKRILSELSESTQSHHVEHSQSSVMSYYVAGKKRKNKKNVKVETNESLSRKTSLILVEDADLLFCDHDEGFLNAVTSLAAASKRPIILVANNPNCPHLMKFSDYLSLKLMFTKPRASKLGMWLRTLALVEGISLSKEQAMELVHMNDRDVRCCLLQLQACILSGISQECNEVTSDALWWQWPSHYNLQFYLPTIGGSELEPEQEVTDRKLVRPNMDSIAKLTDRLSKFDALTCKYSKAWFEDPCPLSWKVMPKDGTSLQDPVGGETDIRASELYSWLVERVKGEVQDKLPHGKRANSNSEIRWRSLLWQAQEFFLPAVSPAMHCSHQVVACDYLPMLRTVGRSERIRLAMYSRRGNRYFNYLQNLGIKANKSFKDFMCDMFA